MVATLQALRLRQQSLLAAPPPLDLPGGRTAPFAGPWVQVTLVLRTGRVEPAGGEGAGRAAGRRPGVRFRGRLRRGRRSAGAGRGRRERGGARRRVQRVAASSGGRRGRRDRRHAAAAGGSGAAPRPSQPDTTHTTSAAGQSRRAVMPHGVPAAGVTDRTLTMAGRTRSTRLLVPPRRRGGWGGSAGSGQAPSVPHVASSSAWAISGPRSSRRRGGRDESLGAVDRVLPEKLGRSLLRVRALVDSGEGLLYARRAYLKGPLTMNAPRGDVPHFLRVVRALARVPGPTVPLAVIVTVVSSCANTCKEGFTVMEDAGDVGASEVGAGGAAGEGRRRGEEPGRRRRRARWTGQWRRLRRREHDGRLDRRQRRRSRRRGGAGRRLNAEGCGSTRV